MREWIDKETLLPVKIEFLENDGQVYQTIYYEYNKLSDKVSQLLVRRLLCSLTPFNILLRSAPILTTLSCSIIEYLCHEFHCIQKCFHIFYFFILET